MSSTKVLASQTAVASFIIPVLNEAAIVQQQLRQLQTLRESGHELVLVDGGSADGTVELARPLVDVLVCSAPGRSTQMNAGASAARGSLLVFLHIDTALPAAFSQNLQTLAHSDSCWGFSPVRLDAAGLAFGVISWFMNMRSRLTRVATGDQVLCIKKSTFGQIGGFADIALMEDVEICKRLRKLSAPTIFAAKVMACGRKWQRDGVWRTVLLMWRLRLAYFLGADPRRLRAKYYESGS